MTASKLGKTVNVSESTVVRFAAELGFDGYPSMQKGPAGDDPQQLTSIQRIEVSNDRIGNQDILSMVMQSDIEKSASLWRKPAGRDFNQVVQAITSARRIYILGRPLRQLCGGFHEFFSRLSLITCSMTWTPPPSVRCFEQVIRIGQG